MTHPATTDDTRVEDVPGIGQVVHGDPIDDTPDTDETTDADTPDEADEVAAAEAKAARLRRRAQAAEAERDTLREALTAARRGHAEAIASSRLYRPAGLWASGVTPDDVFTATGELDTAALDAAITRAAHDIGLTLRPKPDPYQGPQSTRGAGAASWGDVLGRG